jgi:hypothetical protein
MASKWVGDASRLAGRLQRFGQLAFERRQSCGERREIHR